MTIGMGDEAHDRIAGIGTPINAAITACIQDRARLWAREARLGSRFRRYEEEDKHRCYNAAPAQPRCFHPAFAFIGPGFYHPFETNVKANLPLAGGLSRASHGHTGRRHRLSEAGGRYNAPKPSVDGGFFSTTNPDCCRCFTRCSAAMRAMELSAQWTRFRPRKRSATAIESASSSGVVGNSRSGSPVVAGW